MNTASQPLAPASSGGADPVSPASAIPPSHSASPAAPVSPPIATRLAQTLPKMWLPGLLLAGGIAAIAVWVGASPWMRAHGLGALTVAVVLGMLVGNTVYPRLAGACTPGINVTKSWVLRTGIVLYGLRITFQDLSAVGASALVMDALVIVSTFALASWLGIRVFKLEPPLAMLIGAGSSICGAAAVVATTPVVKASSDQAAVAVATVVVFGTLAMFLYPVLWLSVDQMMPAKYFGVYIGATVHEVAQVIASGNMIGPDFTQTAVVTKLGRVMMLAPFLMCLSALLAMHARRQGGPDVGQGKASIPWFAVGFLIAVAVHSIGVLPAPVVSSAIGLADVMLAMAMAALGATTHVSAIRKAGLKAGLLAAALFVWLVLGGGLMMAGVTHVLA